MNAPLILYDAMINAIAECHRVDEVKDLRDKAMALALYARQAKNIDAERTATGIRLRAERRAGELLKEQAANGQRATVGGDGRNQHGGSSQPATTLADLKISPTQSSRWQALADVPDEVFEARLGDAVAIPTTNGILMASSSVPSGPPMDDCSLWLWGRLRDFERLRYSERNPRIVFSGMTETMMADVMRILPEFVLWAMEITGGSKNARFIDRPTEAGNSPSVQA